MERRSGGTFKWVVLTIVLLTFGSCGACVIWLANGPEGGVRAGNQMDPYALEYIAKHGLLEPGEKIISYYDGSVASDGSISNIITDARVIYHKDGRTTSFALSDVETMEWRDEGLIGTVIDITAKDGELMRIEVAPFNGGELFVRDLERMLERARPGAEAVGAEPAPVEATPPPARPASVEKHESP